MVTAIGRLRLFAGILVTAVGVFIAISTSAYLEVMDESLSDYGSQEELAFTAGFVGAIFVIQGVIGIIIALGILGGKKWAWSANVVYSAILIVLFASDIALGETRELVGLIFNAFLLAYMFTGPVKFHFGRVSPAPQPTSPASPPLA